jgi:hypothetical protein
MDYSIELDPGGYLSPYGVVAFGLVWLLVVLGS